MRIHVGDRVSHAGTDYHVRSITHYRLADGGFQLCALDGGDEATYLMPPPGPMHDRVIMLHRLDDLPIDVPPPRVIAHGGDSYLQTLAGTATITHEPATDGAPTLSVWRYHAAGDKHLILEAGRTLVGHGVPLAHIQVEKPS